MVNSWNMTSEINVTSNFGFNKSTWEKSFLVSFNTPFSKGCLISTEQLAYS